MSDDEQKKFLVKDFINYVSPCFACTRALSFYLIVTDKNDGYDTGVSLKINLVDSILEINLKINYKNAYHRLWILPKNNQFITNNNGLLTELLKWKKLQLCAECRCGSITMSDFLSFHPYKNIINAVSLHSETLQITHNNKKYYIESYFNNNSTHVMITSSLGPNSYMELPLIPRYKMKTKENFIKKISTYLLFS